MPSYRSLLVFALAASTVTPVLAGEVDIRPLYGIFFLIIFSNSSNLSDLFDFSSKNEGRALSHLELVERDKQPLEVPPPRKSTPLAVLAPKSISGKMKALIGVGMVATIAADWALLSHFHHLYDNSNPSDSTPPNSSPNFATPPSNAPAPQQNYVFPQAAVSHLLMELNRLMGIHRMVQLNRILPILALIPGGKNALEAVALLRISPVSFTLSPSHV
jgi:hypothetical protein